LLHLRHSQEKPEGQVLADLRQREAPHAWAFLVTGNGNFAVFSHSHKRVRLAVR
jgi:hypothetical protein